MSSFNLAIEYPIIDYNWYRVNSDGITPKCPANWILSGESEFARYKYYADETWKLQLKQNETVTIPFKTKIIEDISIRNFIFNHVSYGIDNFSIKVWFNDTNYEELFFVNEEEVFTSTVNIPNNTEYIKIEPIIDEGDNIYFYLDVDVEFDITTDNFDINVEQNNTSIKLNNKSSLSVGNTNNITSLKNREVYYSNDLILKVAQEKQLNEIVKLVRYNKLLISVNINSTEEAGNSLANMATGSLENITKYWYMSHDRTQKTGIYSYISLNYKYKKNNNIYI